ncbi:MAG TPA: trypsin-like peptidase domain-containing protein [Candidatus Paceibacterota bacterium]|nr:trypsin-like peptidase domain-containing protein [Candidatus Paceibacterota bacterium]
MFCKHCGDKLKDGVKFCTNCGNMTTHQKVDPSEQTAKIPALVFLQSFFKKTFIKLKQNKRLVVSIVGVVIVLVVVLLLNKSNHKAPANFISNNNTQSVVDIWCDNGQGGSGTIFTTNGTVLTNNHVITGAKSCEITLPNPATGGISEIYEAAPVIVPKLSEKYDVATLQIDGAYTDSDGKTWGTYPTTFSPFTVPKTCNVNDPSKLGDSVRIYGYPVTSGGYNLTITDGIISSFADDGDILTSAQVDSGNSGGLAVDQNGCWLGIPSAVVSGNYQNLGVIIPGNIVEIFLNNVPVKLDPSTGNTNSVSESAINPQETSDQQCQDTFGVNSEWSGQMDKQQKPTCTCQSGYSWDATGNACATKTSLTQECENKFGTGAYPVTQKGKAVCDCSTGYQWNSDGTSCESTPSVPGCTSTLGYSSTTGISCSGDDSCASGSTYDASTGECTIPLTSDQMCNQKFNNSYSTTNSDGSHSCSCKAGYYWDNNAVGQAGNCFTSTELDQGCNKGTPGTSWDGKYTSDGTYECAY